MQIKPEVVAGFGFYFPTTEMLKIHFYLQKISNGAFFFIMIKISVVRY